MEDIVAVAVELNTGAIRYFLTWGRIQDPVDPEPLEQLILAQSIHFSLGGHPVHARVCGSLQEAAGEPAFYECFFSMCQVRIPFGPKYGQWKVKMNKRMGKGKELWYLGRRESHLRNKADEDAGTGTAPTDWPTY